MSPGPVSGIDAALWHVELDDYVEALELDPVGDRLVAGSLAGDAVLLDAVSGERIAALRAHTGGLGGVSAVAWSASGDVVATGGHDGVVQLYDRAGRHLAAHDLGGWVAALEWSPVDGWLAAAVGRTLVLLPDPGVPGRSPHRFDPVASTITDVAWATNGKRIGVTAYGGVTWYDPDAVPSTEPVRTYPWKGSLLSLAMSPTGKWACGGAQDASVHLWRLWSGDDLSMSGYPAKIEQLAFRPDGAWMAVGCLGEITVWDFGGKGPAGTAPASGEVHDRHITSLAWRSDGAVLASAGADGLVVLWRAPRRQGAMMAPVATFDLLDPDPVPVSLVRWVEPSVGSLTGPPGVLIARADGRVMRRVQPSMSK